MKETLCMIKDTPAGFFFTFNLFIGYTIAHLQKLTHAHSLNSAIHHPHNMQNIIRALNFLKFINGMFLKRIFE